MPSTTIERAEASQPSPSSSPPPTAYRRLVAALSVVLLVLVVVAVVLAVQARSAAANAQRDQAILVAAREQMLALVDINPSNAQASFDRALAGATGEWKQRLVSDGSGLTKAILDAQVNSRATVGEAGIRSADDQRAAVLLVASMFVGNAQSPATAPRPLRVAMALQHEDDRWLVSNVEFIP